MKFFDRDLSWLSFNYRVLMEAMDDTVPLLERLKFIAICSSNLDEFFRVRVSNIRNIQQIDHEKINQHLDFDAKALLQEIHEEVSRQLNLYGATMHQIFEGLEQNGHKICTDTSQIPDELYPELLHYFKTKLATYLKPKAVDNKTEIFLDNQAIYLVVQLDKSDLYLVNIPSNYMGRFASYTFEGKQYFIFIDDIIRLHLDLLFPDKKIKGAYSIKLNKDADLLIEDEYSGNLVRKIEKQIQKRNLGVPSRFLYDGDMPKLTLKNLTNRLNLAPNDLVKGGRYHNLNDFFEINIDNPKLQYAPQKPIRSKALDQSRSLLKTIEAQDHLLHFPYQSYDYVLQYFNEAAFDPDVKEINVTFYRMARHSMIGEALISAAHNGKKVYVFMEVKARFDEQNNLEWAKKMRASGIKIVYSLPGLKVHAKVALVKKNDLMYGFFGTGNLNEKTAAIYCDHGLFSTDEELTRELSNVFQHLITQYTPPPFEHLLVSQFGAFEAFLSKIDREIRYAEAGKEARIIIKVNNLQEQALIKKLVEASKKGVDVKLIVRSICCLIPKKNIQVKRVVDRYLEHGRVFYFHNNGEQEMYLGSADWMNRNLHRRIEVCFPIRDDHMKQEILTFLKYQWKDDVKGVWLTKKMENSRPETTEKIRAQAATYAYLNDQYG